MNLHRIDICSPPDREQLVAAICYDNEQWAELNQEKVELVLEIYARHDGNAWVFPFDEAITALCDAKKRLLDGSGFAK